MPLLLSTNAGVEAKQLQRGGKGMCLIPHRHQRRLCIIKDRYYSLRENSRVMATKLQVFISPSFTYLIQHEVVYESKSSHAGEPHWQICSWLAHEKSHRSFIKPCRSLNWGKEMPLSSREGEESLDITTAAQIAAAQKGLCNFVLLTGREQPVRIAWAQSTILAAPLLLRTTADAGASLLFLANTCGAPSFVIQPRTGAALLGREIVIWSILAGNVDPRFLKDILVTEWWWQQLRLGESEGVNEMSGRGLYHRCHRKNPNMWRIRHLV